MATRTLLDLGAALLGAEVRSAQVSAWLDAHQPGASAAGYPDLWVPPTLVAGTAGAQDRGFVVGSTAGYPTGLHEPLVKAAEARLAVQQGAAAIALCVPAESSADPNRALMEAVTVREAVPSPVRLCVVLGGEEAGWPQLLQYYARAGIDAALLPTHVTLEALPSDVWESARGMDLGVLRPL
ncbi:hypothetical protein L1O03_01220 [Corynebacterium uropygiale]|uniref:Deoxyribose-phosphate aldolase n=1 Tax=Corynebacterium uropygiale TaxID=1775911 RepID=A0A9X1QM74_9CORY|nr:hypothetical protein [Corynebacterium uropygiale]MCF4005799.1 hypothetical protein [Corynebacterium uropygiale]